ncbi:helix-turn-helix domain-containing protein [archaeon AH-315-M20]|nr:helix-turn-helix domain-containing protein [archaeon AH-315-M20]
MYKLNFKKRMWIVKQYLKGKPTSDIASAQNVSRMTISKIVRAYKQYSWEELKDHKTGRPETKLSKNAEIIILDLRKRYAYGACHIEQILRKKGFGISHSTNRKASS